MLRVHLRKSADFHAELLQIRDLRVFNVRRRATLRFSERTNVLFLAGGEQHASRYQICHIEKAHQRPGCVGQIGGKGMEFNDRFADGFRQANRF